MLVLGEEGGEGEREGGGEGEEEEQVPYSPVLESRVYIVGQKQEKEKSSALPRSRIEGIQYIRIPSLVGQKQEKEKKCPPPPFSNRGNTIRANTEPRRAG